MKSYSLFSFMCIAVISFSLIAMEKENSLNQQYSSLEQQLFLAVERNKHAHIWPLIQKGVNINIQNEEGNTPLHKAAHNFNKDMLISLLLYKPDLTIQNNNGESSQDAINAMYYENKLSNYINYYQKNLERCENDSCDPYDNRVDQNDYLKGISSTVAHYKGLNSPSWPIEQSLSHIKAYNWHKSYERLMVPLIKILLEHGAQPDLVTQLPDAQSPLHLAAHYGAAKALGLLITYTTTIDILNSEKETPLFIAVKQEEKDCVKLLLNSGASINAVDRYGNSPLHYAVCLSNQGYEMTKLLSEYFPDLTIKNNDGQTALQSIENPAFGWARPIINTISNYINGATIKVIKELEARQKNSSKL